MVHKLSNIEESQQLPASEQSLYDQHEQSVEMHRSMLPNPSNFQENQQLPGIEQNLYGQLDQTVENHQQMLQAINTCRHLMILSSGCLVLLMITSVLILLILMTF